MIGSLTEPKIGLRCWHSFVRRIATMSSRSPAIKPPLAMVDVTVDQHTRRVLRRASIGRASIPYTRANTSSLCGSGHGTTER